MRRISPIATTQPGLPARLRLDVLEGARSRQYLFFGLGLPLGLLVGYSVSGVGAEALRSVDGVAWSSWLMVAMAAFGAMSAATLTAARRPPEPPDGDGDGDRARSALVRSGSAWVLALPPLVVLLLAGGLSGTRLPIGAWATLLAELWLGALPFVALGLLVGPLLDPDAEAVVLLGVLVVLAILGGLFQPIGTFPDELAVLARILPSYHLAELGWTSLAGLAIDPLDVLVLAGYTLALGAIVVWRDSERGRAGT